MNYNKKEGIEMTYKDLEDKINQNKIAIRYNIVVEGAAIKPEDYPEVKEGLPTEEPFKSIALGVLYEDKAKVLSDVKESLKMRFHHWTS